MDDGKIGERWKEILERVNDALRYRDVLSDSELDFLLERRAKLETYIDQTYMSVAQLNWLTVIEGKIDASRPY